MAISETGKSRRAGAGHTDPSAPLLGEALNLFNRGQLDAADAVAAQILAKDKSHRDARHLRAMIMFRKGDLEAAAAQLGALGKEFADHAPLFNDYGMVLTRLERYREAEQAIVKALELLPDVPGFHLNLGNVYKGTNMLADAEQHYRAAIYHDPHFANAFQGLSEVLITQGRLKEAARMAARAVELTPNNPRSQARLGNALSEAGLFEQARMAMERAVALAPDVPQFRIELASVLSSQGDLAGAEKILRTLIAAHPRMTGAHANLSRIITYTPDNPHIAQMEALLSSGEIDSTESIALHFALAKAYEDIGSYEASFAQSLAGNELVHETITYPREGKEKQNAELIASFTPALISRLGDAGSADETPIFIVGMPRSGTTLTEQILSSHSKVFGAGELPFMSALVDELKTRKQARSFGELAGKLTPADLKALGEAYVAQVRNFSPDARFIVDKMPGNYNHVGMIRLALPKAKVIYCKRNAPDNCISIFNLRFSAAGLNFAYDLGDLGHTYLLHEELMAHWKGLLPDFICENSYEEMIADSEGQTRKLLAFCGLEWEDACAQFFKTERTVHTASKAQVRQPIYKSSIDRWKRYGPAVQPLLDALKWDETAGQGGRAESLN